MRVGTSAEADALGAIWVGERMESYLGVPVLAGDRVLGLVALSTPEADAYTEADERLLSTVASSVGVALENARLFNETSQRNAELAIVNEIGEALAAQLDFDAIIELVSARLAPMFGSTDMYIGLYDRATNMISFPFELDSGRRVHGPPIELGEGLSSVLLRDRRPLRFGTAEEQTAAGGFISTYAEAVEETVGESWLGVPIMASTEAIGVIAFGAPQKNAFSESDERVLSTVASSMGVALENARLFSETKRLLAETDERAAELAIINSVQEGLVENLEMQAMYDLVGDKIREIFDAQVVDIGIFDIPNGIIRFPYTIERGERLPDEAIPIRSRLCRALCWRPGSRCSSATRSIGRRSRTCPRPSRASRRSRS